MRALRLILLLLACAFATGAAAQYPDKPIRLIVPQAAGSATDTVARILGAELGKEFGQQIVVDNRPGGALTIGLDLTAKAEPDGYTICMGPIGALAITRHMVAKLPYDIERDFQPIALATRGHLLLAVSPTLPFKSVQEIIDYAKSNPGKLLNASSSNGSPGHVGGELFKYMSGTDIVHVPYRGGAAAINDLIAGRVHLMFESLNSIAPHAIRRGARARGQRRAALAGLSRLADDRGSRRSRLRRADLERRHRARRRVAAHHRQAQRGDQQGDRVADVQGPLRRDRRRAGGRYAGRVRRTDPHGFCQVGRGCAALGRSARLAARSVGRSRPGRYTALAFKVLIVTDNGGE